MSSDENRFHWPRRPGNFGAPPSPADELLSARVHYEARTQPRSVSPMWEAAAAAAAAGSPGREFARSPAREQRPHTRTAPQAEKFAVWQGTLMEDLGDHPLLAQGNGGALCARATERWGHWGSLRTSWLVKNSFESWRADCSRRTPRRESRSPRLTPREAEQKGLKAADVNTIVLAVLEGLQAHTSLELRSFQQTVAGPLEDMRLDLQRVGAEVMQVHKEVSDAALSRAAQLLAEDSDDVSRSAPHAEALEDMRSDLQRTCAQVVQLREELRATGRTSGAPQNAGSAPFEALEDMRLDVRRTCAEVVQLREELGAAGHTGGILESAEMRGLTREIEDMKEAIKNMDMKPAMEIQPDFASVYSVIEETTGRLMTAFEDSRRNQRQCILDEFQKLDFKVDFSEVLGAIRRIRFDDTRLMEALQRPAAPSNPAEVLDAIRRINVRPDLSALEANHSQLLKVVDSLKADDADVLKSIRRLEASMDHNRENQVLGHMRRSQTSLDDNHRVVLDAIRSISLGQSQKALEPNHQPVFQGIERIGTTETRPCQQHVELLSAMRSVHIALDENHKTAMDSIRSVSWSSSLGADHSPVLESINRLELHVSKGDHTRQLLEAAGLSKTNQSPGLDVHPHAEYAEIVQVMQRFQAALDDNHRFTMDAIRDNRARQSPILEPILESKATQYEDILEAMHRFQTELLENQDNALDAIKAIRVQPDLSQLCDALKVNHMQLLEVVELSTDLSPLCTALETNHRQLLGAVELSKADHPHVIKAVRTEEGNLLVRTQELILQQETMEAFRRQSGEAMTAIVGGIRSFQETLDGNHRDAMDAINNIKACPDLSSLHEAHSVVLKAISGDNAASNERHTNLLQQMEALRPDHSPLLHGFRNVQEKMDSHQQHLLLITEAIQRNAINAHPNGVQESLDDNCRNMLHAIEETRDMLDALRRMGVDPRSQSGAPGVRNIIDASLDANYGALLERIVANNRDVIVAVETAKSEHLEALTALCQFVSGTRPDYSELHRAIQSSSQNIIRDIGPVIEKSVETAVDHSPLLEAIGNFELKGHSEVLASIKQLQGDLHTELDFAPILYALRELPNGAEFSQLLAGIQRITMDLSTLHASINSNTAGTREATPRAVCMPHAVTIPERYSSPVVRLPSARSTGAASR